MNVNLSEGCDGVVISADNGSLSIHGQITAHCRYTNVFQVTAEEESSFCLYWEPLLDQLNLQVTQTTNVFIFKTSNTANVFRYCVLYCVMKLELQKERKKCSVFLYIVKSLRPKAT